MSRRRKTYLIDSIRGNEETDKILKNSDIFCKNQIRMKIQTFETLLNMIKSRNLLRDTRHISIEQQLVMFLFTLSQNVSNRGIVRQFGHSGETISRYFNECLDAIFSLSSTLIARVPTVTPQSIASDDKFAPYFQDCIGVIDAIFIPAIVPTNMQRRCRDREGNLSQNVLAACTFDGKFCYVLSGWEGSTSDRRILNDALNREQRLALPKGKYYLVDADFSNKEGFLGPYRDVKYHCKEWGTSNLKPQNAKELFNFRHSSLCNVIKQAFGLLRSRFQILKSPPKYPFVTQVKIVNCCFLLHNLIKDIEDDDTSDEKDQLEDGVEDVEERSSDDDPLFWDDDDSDDDADVSWNSFRDELANKMWNDYCSQT